MIDYLGIQINFTISLCSFCFWCNSFLYLYLNVCLYVSNILSVLFSFETIFSFSPFADVRPVLWTDATDLTFSFSALIFLYLMYFFSLTLVPGDMCHPAQMLVFSVPRHSGLAERLPPRNGLWDVHWNFVPLFHWNDISTSQRVSCRLMAIQVFPRLMFCSS